MADSADHLYLIPFGVDSTTPGQRYYGTKAGRSDKKDRVNNRLGQHKKFLQKINNNDSVPAAISLHWDSKGDCGMWENFLVKLGYLDAEDDKLGMGKFFTDPETLIGKRHGPSHKGYVGNYVRAALPKGWEKEAYVVTDHGPKNSLYLTSTGCEQRIQAVHSLYHTQRMLEHVELRKQLQKDDKLLRFCSSINSIIFQGNGSSDEQTDLIDKILKAWGELPQELKSILDTFKDNSNNYILKGNVNGQLKEEKERHLTSNEKYNRAKSSINQICFCKKEKEKQLQNEKDNLEAKLKELEKKDFQ